jgi:hypothetical protein
MPRFFEFHTPPPASARPSRAAAAPGLPKKPLFESKQCFGENSGLAKSVSWQTERWFGK